MIAKHSEIQYIPIIGDVKDYDELFDKFTRYRPDIVYHYYP